LASGALMACPAAANRAAARGVPFTVASAAATPHIELALASFHPAARHDSHNTIRCRYDGPHPSQRTGHWVIRSCFGGCNQGFVLSGSEECKVYVWHRGTGELLAQLPGHTGTVNAVAWNPVVHSMFASASDDRSIHVWGPK